MAMTTSFSSVADSVLRGVRKSPREMRIATLSRTSGKESDKPELREIQPSIQTQFEDTRETLSIEMFTAFPLSEITG
jgi:hypothetical protein